MKKTIFSLIICLMIIGFEIIAFPNENNLVDKIMNKGIRLLVLLNLMSYV